MKKIITNVLFAFILLPAMAQSEKQNAEKTVVDFFEALSQMKPEAIDPFITKDLVILETGELWNADSLKRRLMLPEGVEFKRVNKLTFIKTNVRDGIAWTSYVNQAEFHLTGKIRLAKWIESAVLVKEGDAWKIDQLHSTEIDFIKVKAEKE